MRVLCGVGAALLLMLPPRAAVAQGGDGYLFKQPRVSLSVRAGLSVPRAGSDLFSFTTEQLTVEKGDFTAPALEGRLAVRLTDRFDVMATVGGSGTSINSEFRDWEGTDGLPIEQTTTFSAVSFTLGGKAYLMPRGRSVGRFAWIPARFAPYVGAEAGVVFDEFKQRGEFVDYETLDIFQDYFASTGSAPTLKALAGFDVSVNNRVLLTTEARYAWASDQLSRDFVDFEELDLAGFQLTAGFTVRF